MQKLRIPVLAALLALGACSNLHFPGVYRVDIPQGNFVTSDMIAELKPGMTPDQVRYVLGVPALVDPFSPDTWFYLMTYQPGKGKEVDQQIVVYFKDGIYDHYTGTIVKDLQRQTQADKDKALLDKAARQRRETESGNNPDVAPDAAPAEGAEVGTEAGETDPPGAP